MRINGDRSKDSAGRRCAKLIGTGQKNPRNAERPNCEFLAERPTGRFGDFLTSELRIFFDLSLLAYALPGDRNV